MKKLILGIFITFFLITNVNAKGINPKDFQYFNKDIGITLNFPAEWRIYEDYKKAHDSFKEMLKNRTDKYNPAFLGMKQNQTAFVKLTIEQYQASLAEYVELFETMLINSNITVTSTTYSEDQKSSTVIYQAKLNNLPIRFVDYIVLNNEYALRLSFWTIESLFNKQAKEFTEIAQKALFLAKSGQNNWEPLLANVKIPLEQETPITQNDSKYMFFAVKGRQNTVYIMGSIHVGSSSFYPFPEHIESAFANTPNLVLEVNTASKKVSDKMKNISSYGYLEGNKTLQDVLSKDLYQAVETNLLNYGIPMDKMNRIKPWLVATTLMNLKMMSLGYTTDNGTENYFLEKAGDKTIFELESFEEQMNLFDSIDGNLFLSITLLSLSSLEAEIENLITSWRNKDMQTLEAIIMEGIENDNLQDYFEKFYFKRNLAMTEKIKGYLDQKENYFVLIGAGHLVGAKGILSLLNQAGYQIE
jgi:uncharacterized protein YbaP (TraB family)